VTVDNPIAVALVAFGFFVSVLSIALIAWLAATG
jgi:uncharacterized membrane protein